MGQLNHKGIVQMNYVMKLTSERSVRYHTSISGTPFDRTHGTHVGAAKSSGTDSINPNRTNLIPYCKH